MRLFNRSTDGTPPSPAETHEHNGKDTITPQHHDTASTTGAEHKFKLNKAGEGDVAMALFASPDDIHEPIGPQEERKVVRKLDFMILPYIAVCYAFFYIDKTTLSYAAIFGIEDDLDLHGAMYSWLSSLFYFGFLALGSTDEFTAAEVAGGQVAGV